MIIPVTYTLGVSICTRTSKNKKFSWFAGFVFFNWIDYRFFFFFITVVRNSRPSHMAPKALNAEDCNAAPWVALDTVCHCPAPGPRRSLCSGSWLTGSPAPGSSPPTCGAMAGPGRGGSALLPGCLHVHEFHYIIPFSSILVIVVEQPKCI